MGREERLAHDKAVCKHLHLPILWHLLNLHQLNLTSLITTIPSRPFLKLTPRTPEKSAKSI